jgi:hypothetical protein
MLFISYAREDRAAAARLIKELDAEGIPRVIDPDLTEGDPFWRESTSRQLGHCQLMVCLASTRADQSPWVEQEQRAFRGPKLRIILEPTAGRLRGSADLPTMTVTPRYAVRSIRVALGPRLRRPARKRGPPFQPVQSATRALRICEQERRLDAFLVSDRAGAGELEVGGDAAIIRTGSLELRLRALPPPQERTFVAIEPVTNRQYRGFVDATGYPEPPTWRRVAFCQDNAPVTGVNWFEATAFAAWVGGSLPTEGEWMAAACGTDGARRFATSNGSIDHAVACFDQPFGAGAPAPTIAHPPNPEGYYGLCGNTWDWCTSAAGAYRVIRGGGCMDAAAFCRIDTRYRNAPIDRDTCVGFRIKTTLE